jgi:glycosyltransferase involved in cell wall biosynthesis
MTKILQMSTRHNVGGVSKLIIELLGDESYQQVYVTGNCEGNEKEYSLEAVQGPESNCTFIRIPTLTRRINLFQDFKTFLRLIKIIRREKPDIIHTHMSKAGLLGRFAARASFQKVKLVHSYHGHIFDSYFNKSLSLIIINAEKFLGYLTDAFIFDGNQTAIEINRLGIKPKQKQAVILPGLVRNIPTFKLQTKGVKKLKILVVARIEYIKRIDLVLGISEYLLKEHPKIDFEVNIVGDGELRTIFEKESRRKLLPIKFHGWQENIDTFYKESHLLLSTSDSEGTPLTFMEAAAHGCPVVSTNVGSVADLIENKITGIICSGDAVKISEEIVILWKNKETLTKYGVEAQRKAIQDFGIKKFLQRHSTLYGHLLGQSSGFK